MAFRAELRPLTPAAGFRDDLGLGCAPIGNLYSPVADEDAVATVAAALAHGIRFFDTAPNYGAGESERRLGVALADVDRDTVTIATKVGRMIVDDEGAEVPAGASGAGLISDVGYDAVWRSVEGSLRRLRTDRIDLLHLHDPEDVDAALSGAVRAMVELREQGVVRALGVGMVRTAPLTRFAAEAPVDVIMEAGRLTLLDRTALDDLLPTAAAHGVGILAAGVYNSGVLADPRGAPYFDYHPAPSEMVATALRLEDACRAAGVSLTDAAVQFAFRHDVEGVVVGARTPDEVAAFAAAATSAIPESLWDRLDRIAAG
ncbi:aldo/keto reductase [Microbacterium sp. CIAB417]|uniref:aldo/keto reductase n=1 Tax=Microbacterium sp. CIAB417 TaxID=2860287 RepID=UPI001FAC5810|nr:aldo/keto reductase [Microbacterium sp. CIAB417]